MKSYKPGGCEYLPLYVWQITEKYTLAGSIVSPPADPKGNENNQKAYALSFSESNLVSHIFHNLLVSVMYQNSDIVSVSRVFMRNVHVN